MDIVKKSYDFRRPLSKRQRTDYLVFHHVGEMPSFKVDGDVVHGWHRNRKTDSGMYWSGIGYNALILEDGTIEEGRPFDMQGAHTPGINSVSFGVLVVGNFEQDDPKQVQVDSAIEFGRYLVEDLYPGIKRIGGHSDFASSACPGRHFPLQQIKEGIRKGEDIVTEENLSWQQEQTMDMIEKLAELGYLHNPDQHIKTVKDVKDGRKVRDFVLITLLARLADEIEKLKGGK